MSRCQRIVAKVKSKIRAVLVGLIILTSVAGVHNIAGAQSAGGSPFDTTPLQAAPTATQLEQFIEKAKVYTDHFGVVVSHFEQTGQAIKNAAAKCQVLLDYNPQDDITIVTEMMRRSCETKIGGLKERYYGFVERINRHEQLAQMINLSVERAQTGIEAEKRIEAAENYYGVLENAYSEMDDAYEELAPFMNPDEQVDNQPQLGDRLEKPNFQP